MILAQTNCSHPSVVSDVILVSNFLLSIAQYLAHRLISYYWSLTIHPGNIKIPLVFRCFQGVQKEISGMQWVNPLLLFVTSKFFLS